MCVQGEAKDPTYALFFLQGVFTQLSILENKSMVKI